MNILCIAHRDGGLGVIEEWALDKGYNFQIWNPYKGEVCPETDGFDFLIATGGPQRIVELEKYPYLLEEIALIKSAVDCGKVVLGICLGAQLVGEAFDAKGECSPEREIGIFPICLTEEGQSDPLLKDFPSSFPVFHLHNDMPGLSKNAVILAYSDGCPRQIVCYTPKVYGLQCHLEMEESNVERMIEIISEEQEPSEYIQAPQVLLAQDRDSINQKMFTILDRMVALSDGVDA